jgi:segregation and condensation protein B
MPSKLDELVFQTEAILFAAGKPMSVKELTAALGLDDFRPVQRAVRTLEQTYAHRQSALEVRRVGDRYALQLQERYVAHVQAVTPVEMAPRTLKALTLVAYHQPILQSVLVRMMGDVTYEEVQRLRGLGLVHTEPKGSTLELTTTRRFAEYFGLSSTRPEEIRRFLEQKLGVAPAPLPAALAESAEAPPPDGSEPPAPAEAPAPAGAGVAASPAPS